MRQDRNVGKAPKKPGAGRQPSISVRRVQDISNLLAAGNYVTVACQFVGIGQPTYSKWRTRGEVELDRVASKPQTDLDAILLHFEGKDPELLTDKGEPMDRGSVEYMWTHRPSQFDLYEWPYVVFALQIERAQAAAEIRILNTVHKAAGAGDWRAGTWWLEKRFPERYGNTSRVTISGDPDGAPIQTEVSVVTVEELNEKVGRIIKGKKK